MSTDVTFFETTPFSFSSPINSQEEGDDLLVYTISSPGDDLLVYTISSLVPPAPTPAPASVKPPITQVYSRRQNPPVSSPTLTASSSDLVQNDDLPIALRKGKDQCVHPISSFVSYNPLSSSSYSFIASLDSISLPNTVCEAISHPG